MKYLIILGDGMADEPIPRLGGRTPLQAARKPTIDRIAALGASGILDTVPEGFAPGSEIAHLSLLGYDVPSVFEGRGSLEAAGMGVEIGRGEMVMRCNLITVEQERIRKTAAFYLMEKGLDCPVRFDVAEVYTDGAHSPAATHIEYIENAF